MHRRDRKKAAVIGLAAASGIGVLLTSTLGPGSAQATETYSGVATYFDADGQDGLGCGVPPAQIESKNFVALNVWNTPGEFATNLPRPVPTTSSSVRGVWDNGLNCGRWVRIKLSDYCTVSNGGAAGDGICKGGAWKTDEYNGATLDAVVTDSCGDANEWCRSSKYHLDLSHAALSAFKLGDQKVGDLESLGEWNNREVNWSFIPAPDYSGDIKIGFAKDAGAWYAPVLITHLPNGIHGVEYFDGSAWKKAAMTSDNGQRYEIRPESPGGDRYRIRVIDADDKLLAGGREYTFGRPGGCAPCAAAYTGVQYTTSGGNNAPSASSAPTGESSPSADASLSASHSPSGTASSPGTSANPFSSDSVSPAPTPGSPTGCSARMTVTDSWNSGFTTEVRVRTQNVRSKSWKVSWTWPGGQQPREHWNAALTQSGRSVAASSTAYNGSLAASSSTSFGMTVDGGLPSAMPKLSCTIAR
ncbi:cellulose binding domain-containing protein [Streptomyces griseofuscus]|uniref:cellulose binding domain-containing protein n=1 Tax=Streptomyces griseofuscus TaxID=146922 RepID=UPI0036B4D941